MAPFRGIPPLTRLTETEAMAIESMFRLYDYNATGRIPQHLMKKLTSALGFDFSIHSLPLNGSLKELLLFLDMRIVDPEPALNSQMYSFTHLVAKKIDLRKKLKPGDDDDLDGEGGDADGNNIPNDSTPRGGSGDNDDDASVNTKGTEGTPTKDRTETKDKYITTESINEFMISLGRPPLSAGQCELLLTSMLDYDDCNERTGGMAGVLPEFFDRDFTLFAKKSNALKGFK